MNDADYLMQVALDDSLGVEYLDEVAAALSVPREWEASRTRARLVRVVERQIHRATSKEGKQ